MPPHLPPELGPLSYHIMEWFAAPYDPSLDSSANGRLNKVLDVLYTSTSPVTLSQVMQDLPQIVNMTEQQRGTPVLTWPWLGSQTELSDDFGTFSEFLALVDYFELLEYESLHVYAHGVRLSYTTGLHGDTLFMCNNEQFFENAPPGRFHKWLGGGPKGKGYTVTKIDMSDDQTRQKLALPTTTSHAPGGESNDTKRERRRYKNSMLDFLIMCAISHDMDHMVRLVVCTLLSLSVVQAVHIAKRGTTVNCHPKVVDMCLRVGAGTHWIGAQIAVTAAVLACVDVPLLEHVETEGRRLSSDIVHVWHGIPNIDEDLLSNNMYWIRTLGSEVESEGGMESRSATTAAAGYHTRQKNIVVGIGTSL